MAQQPLIQIVYTSLVAEEIDGGDFFAMLQGASRKFGTLGITGYLAFAHGRFYQALEGDRDVLDPWLEEAARDPRHHSMTILLRREITERQFPGWRMKRIFVRDQARAWQEIKAIVAREKDALSILRRFEAYLESERAVAN